MCVWEGLWNLCRSSRLDAGHLDGGSGGVMLSARVQLRMLMADARTSRAGGASVEDSVVGSGGLPG